MGRSFEQLDNAGHPWERLYGTDMWMAQTSHNFMKRNLHGCS